MLGKNRIHAQNYQELQAFDILKELYMKLSLEKCISSVVRGKFPGYLVT